MAALLITGFPGFLGSALLPRLLARREGARAICIVQTQHMATARARLDQIEADHPHTVGRIELIKGDITRPGLGIDPVARKGMDDVNEVWHLAAVYDLSVPKEIAHKVNVDGTAKVLDFCESLPDKARLQYVSTCYVSGGYDGEFTEDGLEEGQTFLNHYESTKYEAEVLVRKAMAGGLSATIYRPGVVVGDSKTGTTQKYDGPYFLAALMRRQIGPVAVVPYVADPDKVKFGLVPRDFVIEAMDVLSVAEGTVGKTFALTDPNPPSCRELADTFAKLLGKRLIWLPVPLGLSRMAIDKVPGVEWLLAVPAESLDYFATPTTYSTTNTTAALKGTGLSCPPFPSYAKTLLDFMIAHPEFGSKAMV